ncbi:Uu.00g054150.m01.CDS01 [Anthostomella pinea]|uniref:Uu.00g054150.m01.CDS01 n=1 Tax=Anthostomella pinea TaxID=933095 RepID=A0AAI8VX73_9PEZI|nr:Uu.00g054150.m01.CDS01 [Anthostomella pinea]
MPNFEFVNVGRPGDVKKESTRIRRHVMKDIGKARRKPKKRSQTTVEEGIVTLGEGSEAGSARPLAFPIPRMDGHLSTMVYPTEMDEERLGLARFLFAEARATYIPFRFPWLSMGLSDPAAWHITMANAVLLRNMAPGSSRKPEFNSNVEAMKWYTLSLGSISKRLADPSEKDSEGLVTAVAGFICHDKTATGNFERSEVHFKGLKRLIENKGGLEQLSSPLLRLIICWHDLSGASYRDTTPHFKLPSGSITDIDTGNDTQYLEHLVETWDRDVPALRDIKSAIRATAAIASYINRHSSDPKFWTDEVTAARLLGPALHEVLSLAGRRPLPDNPADPPNYPDAATITREAFRRAALLFLASFKVKFGAGSFEIGRHLDAFWQLSHMTLVDWTSCAPELSLWAHVVVAVQEEESGYRRAWHVRTIVGIMEAMVLTTSGQAFEVVRGIAWVDALVEGRTHTLCEEIDGLVVGNMMQRYPSIPIDLGLEAYFEGFDDRQESGWNNIERNDPDSALI